MLPGISYGVGRVQADERWHIGLGVHLLNAGWSEQLDALAATAATAWGPGIATRERVEHALATHRRRMRMVPCDGSD
jgi:hypothetical protein